MAQEQANGLGLLGPALLGLGQGLLSQGFTRTPQTGFEGLGRGLGLAAQLQEQARNRMLQEDALAERREQNEIANKLAQQRLAIAQAGEDRAAKAAEIAAKQRELQNKFLLGLTGQPAAGPQADETTVDEDGAVINRSVLPDDVFGGRPFVLTPEERTGLALAGPDKFGENFLALQNRKFQVANVLRDDFEKVNADNYEVLNFAENALNSANTGAGDVRLVFAFMKALDPGGRVTEGEFKTVSGAVPPWAIEAFNSFLSGKSGQSFLTGDQRKFIEREMVDLRNSLVQRVRASSNQYSARAVSHGVNPTQVIRPFTFREVSVPDVGPKKTISRGTRSFLDSLDTMF